MQAEFARLLPERLGPPVTVIGFAATTNQTSCFAIREAHFGFAAIREKNRGRQIFSSRDDVNYLHLARFQPLAAAIRRLWKS